MMHTIYERIPISLQNIFTTLYGYKLHFARYGGRFNEYWREIEQTQWLLPDELKAIQLTRLQELIRHSYEHVPYYRRRFQAVGFQPQDLRTQEDLRHLPILSRKDVYRYAEEMVGDNISRRRLHRHHTSGTTGTPLCFYEDWPTLQRNYAFWMRFRGWFQFKPWLRRATLSGRVIVPRSQSTPPYWRFNRVENQLIMSSFHLSDKTIPVYIAQLEIFKPFLIDGYVSTIHTLARYINTNGITSVRPTAVQTTSETLLDYQRRDIEEAFQCHVYNQYGHGEKAAFISECEHGTLHINDEYGVIEIINAEKEYVQPGETGEMIVTGLNNWAMPLIRYRTGDLATASLQTPCKCGRGLSHIKAVEGRIIDALRMPDGNMVPPTALTLLFDKASAMGIEEAQIVQKAPDLIVVNIVPRKKDEALQTDILENDLRLMMGQSVCIQFEIVDYIPRTQAGKFKFVKSEIT